MIKQRVCIYCRVSTTTDEQLEAIDIQEQQLRQFVAEQADWELNGFFKDTSSGTTTAGRRGYNQMLEHIEQDEYDILVVKDESRVARDTLTFLLLQDLLVKHNVRLYFYLERRYCNFDDMLISTIKAAVATDYSKNLSRKISAASSWAQKHGTIYGNNNIYGYRKDNGRLVIDEGEAKVVRRVFDLYIQGNGVRKISEILWDEGVKSTTGGHFAVSTLKRMVRNEKYRGCAVGHKTQYNSITKKTERVSEDEYIKIYDENLVPRIVSDDVWLRAQEIHNQRVIENKMEYAQSRGLFQSNQYTLSGKIRCGKCGAPYWHERYVTKVNKLVKNKWYCGNYKQYGVRACDNAKLQNDVLIKALKQIIVQFISSDDVKDAMLIIKRVLKSKDYSADITALLNEKKKLQVRIDGLIDLRADGEISKDEYSSRRAEAEAKIQKLDNDIVALRDKATTEGTVKQRVDAIEKAMNLDVLTLDDDDTCEQIIKELVDKIIVNDFKIDVIMGFGGSYELLWNAENKEYACVSDEGAKRTHTEIMQGRVRRIKKRCADGWLYYKVYVII